MKNKLSKKGLEIVWTTTTVLIFTVIVLVVIMLILAYLSATGQDILGKFGELFG